MVLQHLLSVHIFPKLIHIRTYQHHSNSDIITGSNAFNSPSPNVLVFTGLVDVANRVCGGPCTALPLPPPP